jgi:lipopolysaccharide export system permease protein
MAQKHLTVAFKPEVFNAPFRDFLLYAERISQDRQGMEGIFIQDRRSTEVPLQILAKRGRILRSEDNPDLLTLLLEEGTILQVNPEKEALRRIRFRQYEVNLELALTQARQEIQRGRRKEMDTARLLRKIHKLTRMGKPADQYLVEFHRRLSIPVTCLLFGLLSLPLALQSRPQGRSHGFLLGTLTIVVYYMIFATGQTLAESGRLPFWIPLWAPNLLLAGFTFLLLWRTARERPSMLLVLLNASIDRIQRWFSTSTRTPGGAP